MRKAISAALVLAAAISFSGCQKAPTPANQMANTTTTPDKANNGVLWDAFVESYTNEHFAANPNFAIYQGKHEFDGKLPDWSETGLQKEIDRLKAAREKADAYKDDQLDERQRFERDYLIAVIDKDLFWRDAADQPHTNPYFYADAMDPGVYVAREYAPVDVRIKAYTEYAKGVPAALENVKKNLKFPMSKTLVDIGRQTIGGLSAFCEKDVPKIFEPVKEEQARMAFESANTGAIDAIKAFDKWLGEQEVSKADNFALGEKRFMWMLNATEKVEIDLAKLEEIAQADLRKNLDALKVECEKYAPGKTLMECSNKASASKAGGDLVAAATQQLADLRKFIQEKDIVTVPGTEECKVALAPPYKAWNFAYIEIPGPFEKGISSTYYVAPPDPAWPKEKQLSYEPGKGSLLFTSVHEGYPGHFLQFLHANRSTSKFGQIFVGYAYAEGWAHYTEEMMWDAGLGEGDPEMHVGQLQEALLRNVRFVSAIGFHAKNMTVEESKKMFIEQGMQDEGSAEQQANRGTFDPAYLNYTMGKLMIRKLRDDWCASRGGRAAWKEFHDKFLSYGGPPIPLVRKAMLGKEDTGSLF